MNAITRFGYFLICLGCGLLIGASARGLWYYIETHSSDSPGQVTIRDAYNCGRSDGLVISTPRQVQELIDEAHVRAMFHCDQVDAEIKKAKP